MKPGAGWMRAALELAVVALLSRESLHGYALVQRLTEFGLGPVKGGVLYPVLARLEDAGVVRSAWQPGEGGPGRKVFELTDEGRGWAVTEEDQWRTFSQALDRLLDETKEK
jgi:PadR family transcriptional regulator PadR